MAEKVVVQLVLDTSKYTANAKGAAASTAKIQGAADKTSKSMGGLRSTALKAGAALGAAFAAKAALDFAKSSIAAFSNLDESINAVEVSFGDAAEGVLVLGENSAEQFGLSTRAVNEAAVAMSAFASKIDAADPPGAFENVLQRATDFASVMNIEVEEALLLFRSGLAGESEPLRKFGIDVSAATVNLVGLEAGLGGTNGKLDEGEKVQARYLAIMGQTAKVAGDFANTSEGLANRQRILSAQGEEMQATIGEELEPAMTKLLGVGTKLIPIMGRLGVAIAGSLERFEPLIDLVGVFADQFAEAGDEVEETSGNLIQSIGEFGSLGPIDAGFEKFFSFVSQSLPQQGAAIIDFFTGAADAADEFGTAQDALTDAHQRGATASARLRVIIGNFATSTLPPATTATAKYNDFLSATATRAAEVAAASDLAAQGIRDIAAAQAEAASPALRQLRAQQRLVESQKKLTELRGLTGEDKATAEDITAAVLDLSAAQIEVNSTTVALEGVFDETREAFIEAGVTAGIAREEMELLADTIGTFPTSFDFTLNVNLGKVEDALRRVGGADSPGALRDALSRRRHGGPVGADEPFIVGEGGPELFIPDRAGRIIPNGAGVGGQSIIVNVNDSQTTDLAADLSAGLIAAQITQQVEMLRV